MKKTNIRIDNYFIIEDGENYYLSTVDEPIEWKKKYDDLNNYKDKKVTKKLLDLMDKYSIHSNVNFLIQMKGTPEVKKIELGGGS
jgi:ssDNA-specific exonuclease RecJ|tara:strand:+ start:745 stop:999 length:255 start_codon:yes stop_codon:yes gene_type:complete